MPLVSPFFWPTTILPRYDHLPSKVTKRRPPSPLALPSAQKKILPVGSASPSGQPVDVTTPPPFTSPPSYWSLGSETAQPKWWFGLPCPRLWNDSFSYMLTMCSVDSSAMTALGGIWQRLHPSTLPGPLAPHSPLDYRPLDPELDLGSSLTSIWFQCWFCRGWRNINSIINIE